MVSGTSVIWIGTISPIRKMPKISRLRGRFIWDSAKAAIAAMKTPTGTLIRVMPSELKK